MRRSRIALAVLVAAAFTQGAAFAEDPGAALFAEHCAMCHGANGEGLPGFGPPLGSAGKRLEAPGGREYLAQVVVYGISGVFELAGQRQFAAMTPQGKLSDDELATVLNHVLRDFNGNAANPLAPADIAAARRAVHTPGELHKTKAALERLEK